MRIGIGYDLHKLVKGRPFIMGGITIESEFGPEGHSDGDALCHAIADALLGASCMGDIGMWFPPGDATFKNANSIELLQKVFSKVSEHGYDIENIDSNIICEKPKLSPHYDAMRKRLADALNLDINKVSVKAKTHEKLGEIGRGEAVAAQAVVLITTKSSQAEGIR